MSSNARPGRRILGDLRLGRRCRCRPHRRPVRHRHRGPVDRTDRSGSPRPVVRPGRGRPASGRPSSAPTSKPATSRARDGWTHASRPGGSADHPRDRRVLPARSRRTALRRGHRGHPGRGRRPDRADDPGPRHAVGQDRRLGAGWQIHAENLAAHLAGQEPAPPKHGGPSSSRPTRTWRPGSPSRPSGRARDVAPWFRWRRAGGCRRGRRRGAAGARPGRRAARAPRRPPAGRSRPSSRQWLATSSRGPGLARAARTTRRASTWSRSIAVTASASAAASSGREREAGDAVGHDLGEPAGVGDDERRPERGGLEGHEPERLVEARDDGDVGCRRQSSKLVLGQPAGERHRTARRAAHVRAPRVRHAVIPRPATTGRSPGNRRRSRGMASTQRLDALLPLEPTGEQTTSGPVAGVPLAPARRVGCRAVQAARSMPLGITSTLSAGQVERARRPPSACARSTRSRDAPRR